MKCAIDGARSVRVYVAGAVAALMLAAVPTPAQAAPYLFGEELPLFNRDLIRNAYRVVTNYLSGRPDVVGGPYADFRNRSISRSSLHSTHAAEQLARALGNEPTNPAFGGPGMAAGYTPTETTGQWIQRHLQPLRDHHVNGWSNVTWSSPRDTHRQTRYDSDIWTITLGADMPMLNDSLLFGMFGSYTNSDVDSTFNRGDVESKIGTVGPYFLYTLNDMLSFDVTVAGVFGEHDNVVGGEGDGRGDQEMDGFFVSLNANANYWVGNYGVQGRVGFLHSDMETDSYTLRFRGGGPRVPGGNNELTQFSLMGQFNYFYDQGLPYCEEVMAMPFVRVTFNYDIDHDNIQLPAGISQHPNDDDETIIALGVSLFGNGPFSGSVEGGYVAGRSKFEAYTVSASLNYAF